MGRSISIPVLTCIGLILSLPYDLRAQSTNSQVTGQITDESGAAVPSSKIVALASPPSRR